jgi:hypothetical protein
MPAFSHPRNFSGKQLPESLGQGDFFPAPALAYATPFCPFPGLFLPYSYSVGLFICIYTCTHAHNAGKLHMDTSPLTFHDACLTFCIYDVHPSLSRARAPPSPSCPPYAGERRITRQGLPNSEQGEKCRGDRAASAPCTTRTRKKSIQSHLFQVLVQLYVKQTLFPLATPLLLQLALVKPDAFGCRAPTLLFAATP